MEKLTKPTVVDTEKQAVWGKPTGRNYIRPTQSDRAHIALNCYEPGVNDEMHCHPGSDHTFFVVEGECTMKGLMDGEEYKLSQHQAVHVPAGWFYHVFQVYCLICVGPGFLCLFCHQSYPFFPGQSRY